MRVVLLDDSSVSFHEIVFCESLTDIIEYKGLFFQLSVYPPDPIYVRCSHQKIERFSQDRCLDFDYQPSLMIEG